MHCVMCIEQTPLKLFTKRNVALELEKHPLQREKRFFTLTVDFSPNSQGRSPAVIPGWPSPTVTAMRTEPNARKLCTNLHVFSPRGSHYYTRRTLLYS